VSTSDTVEVNGGNGAETFTVAPNGTGVRFGVLNPLGLVAFYLPVWFLGNVGAQAENCLEHYGASPGNRKTDSVSSYGRLDAVSVTPLPTGSFAATRLV